MQTQVNLILGHILVKPLAQADNVHQLWHKSVAYVSVARGTRLARVHTASRSGACGARVFLVQVAVFSVLSGHCTPNARHNGTQALHYY